LSLNARKAKRGSRPASQKKQNRPASAEPVSSRPLLGKIAVITGATRGIGLAAARLFAASGCDLAITGRDAKALAQACAELESAGIRVLSAICDVRDEAEVNSFYAAVRQRFGRVDILFNNAGVTHPPTPVAKLKLADWRTVLDTNLTGLFLSTRAALPLMKRGASIVNNLSVAAKGNYPGASGYDASKHGALGFTNTLRMELRERGIRVIALLPGPTDTAMWDVIWREAPRHRMMSPESVAAAVLHAVTLPENATVEELIIAPTGGAL
jgi:NAD(P)-dependent dehydrogenase (short-subunit alcohol dehydrogenase family)